LNPPPHSGRSSTFLKFPKADPLMVGDGSTGVGSGMAAFGEKTAEADV
jgi:hypothetical protein